MVKLRLPKVTVIIANFNGKKYLKRCLDSLLKLNYPKNKLKIIMVDNCSSDDSVRFVKQQYPKVKILVNDVNNYCKAINLGIKSSKSEYVALLNNDTKVDRNWLLELIKIIESDSKIAQVGSKILKFNGMIQSAGHITLPNFYWDERGAGESNKEFSLIEEVESMPGTAALYRKNIFEQVGYFDEDFVLYGEDVDLAFRLKTAGFKIMFVPKSIVYHVFQGSAGEDLAKFYQERNRLLYIAKHYPERLASSLIGSGFFTSLKDASSSGKINDILPDLIHKLLKHCPLSLNKSILKDLFKEIKNIVNYEVKILSDKIVEDDKKAFEFIKKIRELEKEWGQAQQIIHRKSKLIDQRDLLIQKLNRKVSDKVSLVDQKESMISRINQELSARISAINTQKDALIHEKENLIEYLKVQVTSLNQALSEKINVILESESKGIKRNEQIEQLKKQKDALIHEKDSLRVQVTSLNQALSEKINVIQESESKGIKRNEQIVQLKKQIDQLNQNISSKDSQFDHLDRELSGKESKLSEQQQEIVHLRTELNNLNQRVINLGNDLSQEKTTSDKKSDLIEYFKKQILALNQAISAKVNELQEKENELLKRNNHIEHLRTQTEQLDQELNIKDAKLIQQQDEITRFREEVNNLNQHLSTLSDNLLNKENIIQGKDNKINSQQDELSRNKTEINNLNQHLSTLSDDLLTKENILRENDNQITFINAQLNQLKQELSQIYNSRSYRLILRPIWKLKSRVFKIINLLKSLPRGLNNLVLPTLYILPLTLFYTIFLAILLERHLWRLLKIFLIKRSPQRKIVPFEKLKISIVIPNYNGVHLIKECLSSIYATEFMQNKDNEILVVDDSSTDNSVEFIQTNFPEVRLIKNKQNMKFGFTCNRGVKEAKNELVVLINNDIIVRENFLEPILGHFRDESVFAVTPKLYAWDRKTFVWGMHMGRFEKGYVRLWNEAETKNGERITQPSPSLFGIGGAMVFRKNDFLWLGGFDELYRPNCWEDIDIGYRAWKRGLKVIYEPRSLLYHKGKATVTYERHKEIKNELTFTWKNITDSKILFEHLKFFPYHLFKYKLTFLKGFIWASRYFPKLLLHRFLERRFMCCSDKEVINLCMGYYRNFMRNDFKHRSKQDKKNILIITPFLPYPLNTDGRISGTPTAGGVSAG